MIDILLSAVSGLLLMLCFPEYGLSWLVFIALVPLFMALSRTRSFRGAAACGLVTGLVYFGGVLNWIKIVGLWVGPVYGWMAWGALVLFQALFIALFGGMYRVLHDTIGRVLHGPKKEHAQAFLGPILWMVIEWLRALGPFAVTAGDLVYSQYTVLPFIQAASLIGSFGISFMIVLVNQTLTMFLSQLLVRTEQSPRSNNVLVSTALITLVLLCLMLIYGHYAVSSQQNKDTASKKINIAVFQPNIPQERKLDPMYFQGMKDLFITETKRFSRAHRPDLIVWPETIIPELLLRDRSFIFRAKEAGRSHLLLGTPTLFGRDIFNSLVLISPQGREIGFYHKRHLAPFGEYLPFRKLLLPFLAGTNFFSNDYSPGPAKQDLFTPWGRIAAGICFESILPASIRSQVRPNASFIVVITNDAWFKQTAALENHLSMSVLRAVENRKALVQAANTGYSALVSSTGRTVQRSSIERQQWLHDSIPLRTDMSLYSRIGDIPVILGLIFLLFFIGHAVLFGFYSLKERRQDRIRSELHEDRPL